jgi:cation transport ATPase
MLITIVLLERYIETHARKKVTRGIHDLFKLTRHKDRRILENRERWISPEAVEPGDRPCKKWRKDSG